MHPFTPTRVLLVVVGAAIAAAAVTISTGLIDVAADVPHSSAVRWILETTRERSIARRSDGVVVPDLSAPSLVAAGAPEYAEMCSTCHRAPGEPESELRRGLNPMPPDLTQRHDSIPAQVFWVIKHGVRMTAMPAWGATHDDQRLWTLVAFLQRLPTLTAPEYAQLTQAKGDEHSPHGETPPGEPTPHGHRPHDHPHAK